MTTAQTAKELAGIAGQLADISAGLSRIAAELAHGPVSPEDEAVKALTPAGQELARYLVANSPDGIVRYSTVLTDFNHTPAALGGILGGIKRRRQPPLPPVIDFEPVQDESDDWLVVMEPRYIQPARNVL